MIESREEITKRGPINDRAKRGNSNQRMHPVYMNILIQQMMKQREELL